MILLKVDVVFADVALVELFALVILIAAFIFVLEVFEVLTLVALFRLNGAHLILQDFLKTISMADNCLILLENNFINRFNQDLLPPF